jgi:co-chaperonin GroES (HSP10)
MMQGETLSVAQRPVFAWTGFGGLPDDIEKGEWFTDPSGKLRKAYDDIPNGQIPWLDPNDIGAFLSPPDFDKPMGVFNDNVSVWPKGAVGGDWSETHINTSGITPTEFKVLILPKEVEEKTKGGIILAVETTEKEKWATIEGVLIAKAPLAFTYASAAEWAAVNAEPPPCGKRILFAKYSGVRHKGRDGVEYVIANDKDVLAILD